MTGYGRGVAETDRVRASVEIRSVNHRFLDVKVRGGALDPAVEERITSRVRDRLRRGAVAVTVRTGGDLGAGIRVDVGAARRIHRELGDLAAALGVAEPVGLELVCAQPGVLAPAELGAEAAALADCAGQAADRALDSLVAMREAEGRALAAELLGRLERLDALTADLAALAAEAPAAAQKRLADRLGRLLAAADTTVDAGRLAQEVAILADRLDVTEELVRARSHIDQLRALVRDQQPVGRRLEFLVQELGREYNTVASKSQSAEIARTTVEVKAELEKLREQIQNIE